MRLAVLLALAAAACAPGLRASGDAGADAAVDAAVDAGVDAGPEDAGEDAGDAGIGDAGDAGDAGTPDAGCTATGPFDAGTSAAIAARPYTLHVPASWDRCTPAPLVLMFHGYGWSGAGEEGYLKLAALADEKGFLYAYTDGTVDKTYRKFWEGTDACCDAFGTGQDDVAYTRALLDDVEAHWPVDPKRVYVFGHSNGGFMAHRLACDLADRIAAIVSLAGAVFLDASKCRPAAKIAVAEIHGDADQTISYDGGQVELWMAHYPSAHDTVAQWAAHDGCSGSLTPTGTFIDLDTDIAGNETRIERYPDCPVELWTVQGGPHIPPLPAAWAEPVWDFFAAHPKP